MDSPTACRIWPTWWDVEPTTEDLQAIEHEEDLIAADRDIVEALGEWLLNPNPATANQLIATLIDAVDYYQLAGHNPDQLPVAA